MTYSTESVQRLSECHPDLVRVFLQAERVTSITVLEGSIDLKEATADGILDSEQLHRPSNGLRASPGPFAWPVEPQELLELSTRSQESIRRYSQELARWWYLGGVVSGVAETLYDRGAIESRIEWIGEHKRADLTRYRRRSDAGESS